MTIKKFITGAMIASGFATSLFAATAYQNQVGFLTNGQKQMAVIGAEGKDIQFKDETGKVALTVTAPKAETWVPAGDTAASLVDFSELKTAGTYQAYVGDEKIGHPIKVADDALEAAAKASLKFFYYQRASMELTEEYAGQWAREAGHPDTAVAYHKSTGHDRMVEPKIASPKGWYDAGDYGKYVVNSGITTYTLLQLYQHNKEYFKKTSLNIPESKNDIPDLLDEIKWNLDWMLTMQDTDGGVFHKLTTLKFVGTVTPLKASSTQRYVIGKAEEATLNFAAVMALASEIYKPYDPEFSQKAIDAAQRAYMWADEHTGEVFEQPSDVGTGSYTGSKPATTRFWAQAEIFRVSGDSTFAEKLKRNTIRTANTRIPSWQDQYMLAVFTIATNPNIFDANQVDSARTLIINNADKFVASLNNNGYGIALDKGDFNWGSNGIASNKAMILVHAYILTKEEKYLNAANGIVDYVLGRNPVDKSYLTGYGVNPTMNPHHRPSQSDSIEAPVPGMVAGGANSTATDCAKTFIDKNAVAKSYYDNSCSYATNEVAINWNAPFAYAINSLQAIAATNSSYDVNEKPLANYELTPIAKKRAFRAAPVDNQRLIVRGNKVQLEFTKNGVKSYLNVNGKRVR
ncbi:MULTISPECIES: glycoside hydrolase family 9 protein [unclassified Fibrobacter]|uniref:glycoside hydrolase family 9 protein n=1 Tax=unclassified Fibrobacter TaxID=2634177 RepID=UPI000D7A6129|nr:MULTISPECIES: glycoside hydrolase family 9 protein [unclassified Fibrobacter]PWJ65573.1 endoglucanase [Fibrobacter sp. UWR4]PZW72338.1 endoglucanase [Fibrobacter sp. UWR1]